MRCPQVLSNTALAVSEHSKPLVAAVAAVALVVFAIYFARDPQMTLTAVPCLIGALGCSVAALFFSLDV